MLAASLSGRQTKPELLQSVNRACTVPQTVPYYRYQTKEPPTMTTWKVELYDNGRKMEIILEANSQREACKFAELRAPGYRAGSAQEHR